MEGRGNGREKGKEGTGWQLAGKGRVERRRKGKGDPGKIS